MLSNSQSHTLDPERWVNAHADGLFAYCMVRVRDRQTAEDIVQDTFLSAWRARHSYRGEASEKNWLYAILKNKIIDHYRKQLPHAVPDTADEERYFDESGHWTAMAAPAAMGAEVRLNSREFQQVLAGCSAKLRPQQRAVFVLRYLEGMEAEMICREMDISSTNFWVLMHRARLHLRACLEKNGWGK